MTRSFLLSTAIVFATTSMVSAATLADNFSSFYVLGDSNSDWGNFGVDGPPPPYFQSQFSNGPVWADLLDDQFETGNPDDIRTWNYAFGGARVTETSDVPDLPTQLQVFAADLDPNQDDPLPGTPVLGERPLLAVWFGANDIRSIYQDYLSARDTALTLDPAQQAAAIAQAQASARGAATEVGAIFGNTLLSISQFPQFGDLLALTTADAGATPEYDDPIDRSLLTELSVLFNEQLSESLFNIRTAGVNVYTVDIFQLQQDVIANPALFGFDNVTDPCLSFDLSGPVICDTPDTYLFWDEVGHLSGAAHNALANIVEQTILTDLSTQMPPVAPVPVPASLPLLGAGIAVMASIGRRSRKSGKAA